MNTYDIDNKTPKFHPWEIAGLGISPFFFIQYVEIPPAKLAKAHPGAYKRATEGLPDSTPYGECSHCGKAIQGHFIIGDSTGEKFSVGGCCLDGLGKDLSNELKHLLRRA